MRITIIATSLCIPAIVLGWSVRAHSQSDPAPAPTYYTPPAPTEPAPPVQQPEQPPLQTDPAAPPAQQPPVGEPQAPQPGAPAGADPNQPGVQAGGSWSLDSGLQGYSTGSEGAAQPAWQMDKREEDPEAKRLRRIESLTLHNNLYGSTGLLRISDAGSGEAGTFRMGILGEWFTSKGFLCTEDYPCGNKTEDRSTRFGTTVSLSLTPLSFLEVFGSFRSQGTSNDVGYPKLLQSLGDSILGVKGFMPSKPDRMFRFGGELQVLMLSSSGSVGPMGKSTGLRVRAMGTLDLTTKEKPIPFRTYLNIGYHLDNSGQVIKETEEKRGNMPITRLERFGLAINRTDAVELGLAVEAPLKYVRPFLGYTVDIPTNRQGYVCDPSKATTRAFGDECLGAKHSFGYIPSRLSIGARGYPVLKGLSAMLALDIGVTGTKKFLEELSPQPKWTLFFGLGYAVDVIEPEPVVKVEQVGRLVAPQAAPQRVIRARVIEKGTTTPVVGAVAVIPGSNAGGYVTGPEGVFETRSVEYGTYTFQLTAEGYEAGACTIEVQPQQPGQQPYGAQQPYANPQGYDAQGQPTYGTAPEQPQPQPASGYYTGAQGDTGAQIIEAACEMQALPKMGNAVGRVSDAETSKPIGGVAVVITDAAGQQHRATTDDSGAFRIDNLTPGVVQVSAESEKFFVHNSSANIEPRKDADVVIQLNARPKRANVIVTKTQIIIRKQINFETDSAVIKGESTALMEEIADVFRRNPEVKMVEVQGHTDNTGSREHNQDLSERRANAVKEWLVSHGISADRLDAKGYGQTRPLAPNVTAANRAKNRRVQFVIKERE